MGGAGCFTCGATTTRPTDPGDEATSRLSKKVDVLTLAKITGHKDLNMLMVYYDEDMSEVAKRIG